MLVWACLSVPAVLVLWLGLSVSVRLCLVLSGCACAPGPAPLRLSSGSGWRLLRLDVCVWLACVWAGSCSALGSGLVAAPPWCVSGSWVCCVRFVVCRGCRSAWLAGLVCRVGAWPGGWSPWAVAGSGSGPGWGVGSGSPTNGSSRLGLGGVFPVLAAGLPGCLVCVPRSQLSLGAHLST